MSLQQVRTARELVRADVIADILDSATTTVYEAARDNPPRIGGVVRFGRQVRFDLEKFYAWLDAGGEALPGGWRQEPPEAA
jgi:hypothetical protein